MTAKTVKTDEEWKTQLNEEEFRSLENKELKDLLADNTIRT